MSKILAIDLGKFKSVTCLLETDTNATEFWTMATERHYFETVLNQYDPDLMVIEACAIAGWVHDVCTSQDYPVLVCNPAQEPWKWKHLKRKTDRDDASIEGGTRRSDHSPTDRRARRSVGGRRVMRRAGAGCLFARRSQSTKIPGNLLASHTAT